MEFSVGRKLYVGVPTTTWKWMRTDPNTKQDMKSTTSLIAAAIAWVFAAGSVATHAAPLTVAAASEEKDKEGCPAKDKNKEGCPAKKKEGTVLAEEAKEKEGCPAKDKNKEGCPAKKKEEKKEGTIL